MDIQIENTTIKQLFLTHRPQVALTLIYAHALCLANYEFRITQLEQMFKDDPGEYTFCNSTRKSISASINKSKYIEKLDYGVYRMVDDFEAQLKQEAIQKMSIKIDAEMNRRKEEEMKQLEYEGETLNEAAWDKYHDKFYDKHIEHLSGSVTLFGIVIRPKRYIGKRVTLFDINRSKPCILRWLDYCLKQDESEIHSNFDMLSLTGLSDYVRDILIEDSDYTRYTRKTQVEAKSRKAAFSEGKKLGFEGFPFIQIVPDEPTSVKGHKLYDLKYASRYTQEGKYDDDRRAMR